MNREDGWIRHRFAPGEEPTVYTADICADVGHEHCKQIDEYEGKPVFCICFCDRAIKGNPN